MSRETDSASPAGRGGGAAYPSGTPPYGVPRDPASPPLAGQEGFPPPAAAAGTQQSPKTETTLTTRVRINIPGSRPIPPVVVRRPVADGGEDGGPAGSDMNPAGAAPGGDQPQPSASATRRQPPGDGDTPGQGPRRQPSDWFAPRRAPHPGTPEPEPAHTQPMPQIPAAATPPDTRHPGGWPGSAPAAEPYGATGPVITGPLTGPPSQAGFGQPGNTPFPDLDLSSGGAPHPEPDSPIGRPETASAATPAAGVAGAGAGPGLGSGPGLGVGGPLSGPTAGPVTGPLVGQQLGAEPRSGYRPADTLVGGIAPVPPPGPPLPKQDEPDDSSTTASPSSSSSPAPKRKRGRSKLMMVAVVLLGGAAVAYGAGLLLGHDDVPRGTSVLGVEIGGQTRDEAVKTLDGVLTRRTTAALPVKIGDASSELDPQVAGLSIDTTVTVRNAAHRGYNPVTVIGSLFGQKRLIEPQVNVDEDKLRGALETLSASAGNGRQEGGVKFVSGKAVAIQPKAGLALDVDAAMARVRDAFVARGETGQNPTVALTLSEQKPKVTQSEIDFAMNNFGKTAMSGWVTVEAVSNGAVANGGNALIQFSPENSLGKFLSMTATADGGLEPHFDLQALEGLYGSTFDGLQVDHGGSVGPITARDVASVMLPALKQTDPDKRVVEIQVVQ